jgi:hypothetical protein
MLVYQWMNMKMMNGSTGDMSQHNELQVILNQ